MLTLKLWTIGNFVTAHLQTGSDSYNKPFLSVVPNLFFKYSSGRAYVRPASHISTRQATHST